MSCEAVGAGPSPPVSNTIVETIDQNYATGRLENDTATALPTPATPSTIESSVGAGPSGGAAGEAKEGGVGGVHETSPNGQRYVKLDVRLGAGAYKDVWRAYDTHEGIEVAWNVIKLKRIPVNDRKRVKNEVLLLKEIEHKNIIKYHSSWIDREKQCIIFITEIMSSGSLKEYLRKNPMVRWKAVKRWCIQILDGLMFLHSKHIIHRDIKCDNIFINGSTGDIRIGDLGLSTRIGLRDPGPAGGSSSEEDREVTTETMTCLGTPEFMAPELYDETYDVKVDIYAFGMAVLEMITALTPYHTCTSAAQIFKKVSKGELPPELQKVYNRNARAFITSCLQPRDQRPTAIQLMEHDFLKENEAEDFKFVRGKLEGLDGLEEGENEEADEVSEGVEEAVGADSPAKVTLGWNASNTGQLQKALLSPEKKDNNNPTWGPDDISLSSHTGGAVVKNLFFDDKESVPIVTPSEPEVKPSIAESSASGKNFRTSTERGVDSVSRNEDASAPGNVLENKVGTGSFDPGIIGVPGRSRILRVHTRSGSVSASDLKRSGGGPGSPPFVPTSGNAEDLVNGSPEKDEGISELAFDKGGNQDIPNFSKKSDECPAEEAVDKDVIPIAHQLVDSTLPRRFLSTVTVFDLLDVDTGSTDTKSSSGAGLKSNEALIFKMSVPGYDGDCYQEVVFEFNLITDDPLVLVEEMKSDPDLSGMIARYAENVVSVLKDVCSFAKRVAQDRMAQGDYKYPLSVAVLREILMTDLNRDPNKSLADHLAALQSAALIRRSISEYSWELPSSLKWEPREIFGSDEYSGPGGDIEASRESDFSGISDAEIDNMLQHDSKYLDLLFTYQENVSRVEKEFEIKKNSLNSQKEKIEETHKREIEKCTARKSDLNQQLEDMQQKLKERMSKFDEMKVPHVLRQKEKRVLRKNRKDCGGVSMDSNLP